MDTDMKALAKKIVEDREALRVLAHALASDKQFARELAKTLSEAVMSGSHLRASEASRVTA